MLQSEGIDCSINCVRTRDSFQAALDSGAFDLIVSDFTLPRFDGLSALRMAQTQWPDKPFIFVSGTMGEEAAVESLRQGAVDYVLKDRMFRLPAAVKRCMEDAVARVERRRMEKQLQEREAEVLRAQRMETIGALTGGLAHDLNNSLVPILVGLDLLKEEPISPPMRQLLDTMRTSARRASEMVQQVLSFARGVGGQPVPIDFQQLLDEMQKLAGETFPKSINVRAVMGRALFPVVGNPTGLHQVLLNLCINARDAMPAGGALVVETSNAVLEQKVFAGIAEPVSGDFVLLTVKDTGHGMPPDQLNRIFEPFFTTKKAGKGTGLGLSTVHGIVKSHGGFIEVVSEPDRGTAFNIYLPSASPNR
jgi:signal transduction histidine kinase